MEASELAQHGAGLFVRGQGETYARVVRPAITGRRGQDALGRQGRFTAVCSAHATEHIHSVVRWHHDVVHLALERNRILPVKQPLTIQYELKLRVAHVCRHISGLVTFTLVYARDIIIEQLLQLLNSERVFATRSHTGL